MASDQSAVAFERFDAAADADRPPAAAPACDLAELASALAQVEALLKAGAAETPDAAAALERIADIAFVLQEREVEPSLCDALDAAMREIGEANARNRASVQRVQEAAELLRAQTRRLDAMMAAQAAAQAPVPGRLFDAGLVTDGAFAQAVAALAESLPERADAAPARFPDREADSAAVPEALMHSVAESEATVTAPVALLQAEEAVSGAGQTAAPHESVAATDAALPAPDATDDASLALSAEAAAVPAESTHQSIDPDEDPGDLFEPMPGVRPAADEPAPLAATNAITVQEAPPPASIAPQSPRDHAAAPAHAAPPPAANDPLAPIRVLSEEELIALFS